MDDLTQMWHATSSRLRRQLAALQVDWKQFEQPNYGISFFSPWQIKRRIVRNSANARTLRLQCQRSYQLRIGRTTTGVSCQKHRFETEISLSSRRDCLLFVRDTPWQDWIYDKVIPCVFHLASISAAPTLGSKNTTQAVDSTISFEMFHSCTTLVSCKNRVAWLWGKGLSIGTGVYVIMCHMWWWNAFFIAVSRRGLANPGFSFGLGFNGLGCWDKSCCIAARGHCIALRHCIALALRIALGCCCFAFASCFALACSHALCSCTSGLCSLCSRFCWCFYSGCWPPSWSLLRFPFCFGGCLRLCLTTSAFPNSFPLRRELRGLHVPNLLVDLFHVCWRTWQGILPCVSRTELLPGRANKVGCRDDVGTQVWFWMDGKNIVEINHNSIMQSKLSDDWIVMLKFAKSMLENWEYGQFGDTWEIMGTWLCISAINDNRIAHDLHGGY